MQFDIPDRFTLSFHGPCVEMPRTNQNSCIVHIKKKYLISHQTTSEAAETVKWIQDCLAFLLVLSIGQWNLAKIQRYPN